MILIIVILIFYFLDGTNNMFEINRNSSIAVIYNYKSVLENMHISTLWKILK
jgi:hypothetical protein